MEWLVLSNSGRKGNRHFTTTRLFLVKLGKNTLQLVVIDSLLKISSLYYLKGERKRDFRNYVTKMLEHNEKEMFRS